MAGWVLCMTLVLAALAGAWRETRYDKFLRQHVDYPRSSTPGGRRYCETMLARRQVIGPGLPCKPTNTFVHAPIQDVAAACSQPADAWGIRNTPRVLSVTLCRLTTRNTQPPCNYRSRQMQHHVRVACQGGQPVHLNSTIP